MKASLKKNMYEFYIFIVASLLLHYTLVFALPYNYISNYINWMRDLFIIIMDLTHINP